VTAIVALQRGDLEQKIQVSEEDLAVWSMIGLGEGEVLDLLSMLNILLIPSDNAAAMAIARNLAGDVDTFVGWMNEFVAEAGLQDTHFANPSGLDAENNYSSAYDMALIARYVMNIPLIAEIVRYPQRDVAGRRLRSTNEMLTKYPGAIGVKTGTEEQAGECLITWVQRPQGQALVVVMGSQNRYRDATALLDYYYDHFAELRIELPLNEQNRYLDANNVAHAFGLEEPRVVLVPRWQLQTVQMVRRIDNPLPNPSPGEQVGMLLVSLLGKPLTEVPLYAR